jgi:hypothetical protein
MQSVVPQAQSLGNKGLYETLFRNVFAAGEPVLMTDVQAYCYSTRYGAGEHLDAALELLTNIGVLQRDGESLLPDASFLRSANETSVGLAVSIRLLESLEKAGEIEDVFPPGTLSWGNSDGELNIHLSKVPMRMLAIIKLLRDLETAVDSEEGAAIVKVENPIAGRLQESLFLSSARTRVLRILDPEQLERLQEAQAKQGANAEEFVLGLEQERLRGHVRLEFIRRISVTNTAAGYDIESFEGLKSFLPDKFIEVKSHHGVQHFFLSSGELEAAKELAERYYLYLVDMDKYGEAGYEPVVIRNPAAEFLSQESAWSLSTNVFKVIRKNPR